MVVWKNVKNRTLLSVHKSTEGLWTNNCFFFEKARYVCLDTPSPSINFFFFEIVVYQCTCVGGVCAVWRYARGRDEFQAQT